MSRKKAYTVHLQPISDTFYSYEVEADDAEKASAEAFELLRDAIGWDAAKDYECNFVAETHTMKEGK